MYDNIIDLLCNFEQIVGDEYKFCSIDRNSSAINSCAYSSYSGKMEVIQNLILPNILIIKDAVLLENDKYLNRCAEINIEPIKNKEITFEELKHKPNDVTDEF